MAVDVYDSLKQLINGIFGDQHAALQYAQDPEGTLAEQGITDSDLSGVDMHQLVADCAAGHNLPPSTQQALQSYSGGGASSSYPVSAPPATSHTASEVVQHLNYVTYATYEDNDTITQQLINYEDHSTNIDNSVDVEVDGDFHGDIETTNANATGDGAVAAGDDATGVATGDGAVAAGDDIEDSQINTGDGAVQAGDDINAPVNTGEFTGVQAEDVDADNSVFNFGDGDVTNFGDAEFDDTAVAVGGGDATNVSNNELDEGAALSGTGDAEGNFQETDIEAEDSFVLTEQGPGDQELEDNELEEVAGA